MDLKLKYKKETGKEVHSSSPGFFPSGIYSNDYVKWLEEQLLIHSVVVTSCCKGTGVIKDEHSDECYCDCEIGTNLMKQQY